MNESRKFCCFLFFNIIKKKNQKRREKCEKYESKIHRSKYNFDCRNLFYPLFFFTVLKVSSSKEDETFDPIKHPIDLTHVYTHTAHSYSSKWCESLLLRGQTENLKNGRQLADFTNLTCVCSMYTASSLHTYTARRERNRRNWVQLDVTRYTRLQRFSC